MTCLRATLLPTHFVDPWQVPVEENVYYSEDQVLYNKSIKSQQEYKDISTCCLESVYFELSQSIIYITTIPVGLNCQNTLKHVSPILLSYLVNYSVCPGLMGSWQEFSAYSSSEEFPRQQGQVTV